jgi:hypothetical protein
MAANGKNDPADKLLAAGTEFEAAIRSGRSIPVAGTWDQRKLLALYATVADVLKEQRLPPVDLQEFV